MEEAYNIEMKQISSSLCASRRLVLLMTVKYMPTENSYANTKCCEGAKSEQEDLMMIDLRNLSE